MHRSVFTVFTLAALPILAGSSPSTAAPAAPRVVRAEAILAPASGSDVRGTVTFRQRGDRVEIVADVRGLAPNTSHGFHIHENGDCSAPDAASAGGHFNPDQHVHGGPGAPEHHAGDLGNLEADASGRAYKRMVVDDITLDHGMRGVLNRAVIVHEKLDDLTSQPNGNAGARIACGVIMAPSSTAR